jgi:hypothetical protein
MILIALYFRKGQTLFAGAITLTRNKDREDDYLLLYFPISCPSASIYPFMVFSNSDFVMPASTLISSDRQ